MRAGAGQSKTIRNKELGIHRPAPTGGQYLGSFLPDKANLLLSDQGSKGTVSGRPGLLWFPVFHTSHSTGT